MAIDWMRALDLLCPPAVFHEHDLRTGRVDRSVAATGGEVIARAMMPRVVSGTARRHHGAVSRGAPRLALILTALLAGCEAFPLWASPTPASTPVPEYRPEVAAVVESTRFVTGNAVVVTLVGGGEVEIDQNAVRMLGGGTPNPDQLFFYGTDPEPWFYTLRWSDTPGCYLLKALVRSETTSELQFDFGIVLRKASDFDRGSGLFRDPLLTAFCISERGEVTRLYE